MIAVAESCTGGLVGSRITDISGSSEYFMGGIIAYSNQVKIRQLGVFPGTLEETGAVSRQTVVEMARGVKQKFSADIGLSVSGIAGPGGGTPAKPVGTVWVGLASKDFTDARLFLFDGDRRQNKENAADAALAFLLEYLEGKSGQ
ncbi:MAG: CinA family protein [Anaerolineales bacterium]|nr:CinA family protein [Anaerolineales bacterium]